MSCHDLVLSGRVVGSICRASVTDWHGWPARYTDRIKTDCCARMMPRRQTWARWTTDAWYDPELIVRCAPGHGCDLEPHLANGMGLRS